MLVTEKIISDKIDKTDWFVIALAVFMISGGLFLLLAPSNKFSPLVKYSKAGRLETNSQGVSYQLVGSLIWEQSVRTQDIYGGDQVLTDKNSVAKVYLRNGTILEILPQTLIRIERSEEDDSETIELLEGAINITPSADRNPIMIKTSHADKAIKIEQGGVVSAQDRSSLYREKDKKEESRIQSPEQGEKINPMLSSHIPIQIIDMEKVRTLQVIDATEAIIYEIGAIDNQNLAVSMPQPGRYQLLLIDEDKNILETTTFYVANDASFQFYPIQNTEFEAGETIKIRWEAREDLGFKAEIKRPHDALIMDAVGNSIEFKVKESGDYKLGVTYQLSGENIYNELSFRLTVISSGPKKTNDDALRWSLSEVLKLEVPSELKGRDLWFIVSTTPTFEKREYKVKAIKRVSRITFQSPGLYYFRAIDETSGKTGPINKVLVEP